MKVVLIAATVLLAALIIALHFIPANTEPLTELYFENSNQLPSNVLLSTAVPFSERVPVDNYFVYYTGIVVTQPAGAPRLAVNVSKYPYHITFGDAGAKAIYYDISYTSKSVGDSEAVSTPLLFNFTIANHLGEAYNYTYTVLIDDKPYRTGSVYIQNNATATMAARIIFDRAFTRTKVGVLLGTGERIHMWVES